MKMTPFLSHLEEQRHCWCGLGWVGTGLLVIEIPIGKLKIINCFN